MSVSPSVASTTPHFRGTPRAGRPHVRRLQDLVHALGAQGALHEIAHRDGAHKGRQPGVLALLLGDILGEDLGRVLKRRGSLREAASAATSKTADNAARRTYHDGSQERSPTAPVVLYVRERGAPQRWRRVHAGQAQKSWRCGPSSAGAFDAAWTSTSVCTTPTTLDNISRVRRHGRPGGAFQRQAAAVGCRGGGGGAGSQR